MLKLRPCREVNTACEAMYPFVHEDSGLTCFCPWTACPSSSYRPGNTLLDRWPLPAAATVCVTKKPPVFPSWRRPYGSPPARFRAPIPLPFWLELHCILKSSKIDAPFQKSSLVNCENSSTKSHLNIVPLSFILSFYPVRCRKWCSLFCIPFSVPISCLSPNFISFHVELRKLNVSFFFFFCFSYLTQYCVVEKIAPLSFR